MHGLMVNMILQGGGEAALLQALTTIRNIETLTGMDFFTHLTMEDQDKIELKKATALWEQLVQLICVAIFLCIYYSNFYFFVKLLQLHADYVIYGSYVAILIVFIYQCAQQIISNYKFCMLDLYIPYQMFYLFLPSLSQ